MYMYFYIHIYLQSAVCGSIAGGAAAAATTPLDVAKTRIMLAEGGARRIAPVLCDIYLQTGIRGLFAGVTPRASAFFLGGFVFFGVYDDMKKLFEEYCDR